MIDLQEKSARHQGRMMPAQSIETNSGNEQGCEPNKEPRNDMMFVLPTCYGGRKLWLGNDKQM
ncbi:MAG: hypothetical protein HYZ34_01100 [Ignavibacteriae bacterium]|nr:hypothetical protein [Ignavibacteriota bacterium]